MSDHAEALPLAQIIDHFLIWHAQWLQFYLDPAILHKSPEPLPSAPFLAWYAETCQQMPQGQPAMDRLAVTHDQLSQLVRLIAFKSPSGLLAREADLVAVSNKLLEFVLGLRRLERALAIAASGIDPLTGLRSRVGMLDDLQREQERFRRGGKPFCLAMMDIDHFKAVNDTHGHDAGDRVLATVANHVTRSLRLFDDAYRLGGEEFLLCFKETDLTAGLAILERLRASLQQLPIMLVNEQVITVTASFGLIGASTLSAIEDLLQSADQALYRAKQQGRNRIAVIEAS